MFEKDGYCISRVQANQQHLVASYPHNHSCQALQALASPSWQRPLPLQEALHQVWLFHTPLRSCCDAIHCPICLNTSAKSLLCLYTKGADIYCDGEDTGRDTRPGLVIADERLKGIHFETAGRHGRGDAEHTYPQDRWSRKCRWWFALRLSAS